MDESIKGLTQLAEREAATSTGDAFVIVDETAYYHFKNHRRFRTIKEIIIHHSWSKTIDSMARTLYDRGYGTHYAISRAGVIHHLTPVDRVVSHCVHHNEVAIGIDIIRGEGQEILQCQYDALNRLLDVLVRDHRIQNPQLHKSGIFYHRDLRPTECPGVIDDSKIHYCEGAKC